jgi:hypothetical protein
MKSHPLSSRSPAARFSTFALAAAALTACGGGSGGGNPFAGLPIVPAAPAPAPAPAVSPPPAPPAPPSEPTGRWTVGDLHVHTIQSDDTQQISTLDQVLAKAFDRFGLDWAAISDHLRLSSYDNDGNKLAKQIPFSEGMAKYQVPRIQGAAGQAASTADKTILRVLRMGHAHARPRQHRHPHRQPDVGRCRAQGGEPVRIPVHQPRPATHVPGRTTWRPGTRRTHAPISTHADVARRPSPGSRRTTPTPATCRSTIPRAIRASTPPRSCAR